MASVPLGANVGTAWVALRFSAQGSKRDIQKQIDDQTSGVGETAGKREGDKFSQSFTKSTSGIGDRLKKMFGSASNGSGVSAALKGIAKEAQNASARLSALGKDSQSVARGLSQYSDVAAKLATASKDSTESTNAQRDAMRSLQDVVHSLNGQLAEQEDIARKLGDNKSLIGTSSQVGILRMRQQVAGLTADLDKLGKGNASADDLSRVASKISGVASAAESSHGRLSRFIHDMQNVDDESKKLGPGLGSLSGAALPALIGALVAVAPQAAALGTGFAGLGVAAVGVAAPIEKAAKATGGLKANLHTLNPEQQTVAKGILGLSGNFHTFEKAVQPQILTAFSKGIGIAKTGLKDIQPITIATGKAFNGFLSQVSSGLSSSTAKSFFAWMAQQVGPDMRQLGGLLGDVAKAIPPLLQALQPLGHDILTAVDGGVKFVGWLVKTKALLPVVGALLGKWLGPKVLATLGLDLGAAAGPLGLLVGVIGGLVISAQGATSTGKSFITSLQEQYKAAGDNVQGFRNFSDALDTTGKKQAIINAQFKKGLPTWINPTNALNAAQQNASKTANQLSGGLQTISKWFGISTPKAKALAEQAGAVSKNGKLATDKVIAFGDSLRTADGPAKSMNTLLSVEKTNAIQAGKAVGTVNTAWDTFVGNVTGVQSAGIAVVQAIRQITQANKSSKSSWTGLNDASLTLQNDFLQNLIPSTQSVVDSMRKAHDSTKTMGSYVAGAFKKAIDSGALANRGLRTAVFDMAKEAGYTGPDKLRPLKNWIDNTATSIRGMTRDTGKLGSALGNLPKTENTSIHVSGSGSWTQAIQGASGSRRIGATGGFATGGLITQGTGPTSDDVLARVSKGELIVPANMVKSGAVDNLRGQLPGFASGGIVGSYKGNVGGETPWMQKDYAATVKDITSAIANKMAKAFKQSIAAASGGSPGFGIAANGPLQQYAKKLLAAYGWGGQWTPFNDIVMAESGWNVHATNPSSGAYGIPQALPASKMASAGADWRTDGFTQLRWMMGYIKSRYGSPSAAWAFHLANNAYDKGGIANGVGMMPKRTIKPERVLSPHQTSAFDRLVDSLDARNGGSSEPRKMVITGGKLGFDKNGELYIRNLAVQEARAEIQFASKR
jgi:hypothetical protein